MIFRDFKCFTGMDRQFVSVRVTDHHLPGKDKAGMTLRRLSCHGACVKRPAPAGVIGTDTDSGRWQYHRISETAVQKKCFQISLSGILFYQMWNRVIHHLTCIRLSVESGIPVSGKNNLSPLQDTVKFCLCPTGPSKAQPGRTNRRFIHPRRAVFRYGKRVP